MSEFDPQSQSASKSSGDAKSRSSTQQPKPSKRPGDAGKTYGEQVAARVPKEQGGGSRHGEAAPQSNGTLEVGLLDESRATRDKGQLAFLAIVGALRASVSQAEAASRSYGASLRDATKVAGIRHRGDAAVAAALSTANKDERKKAVVEFLSGVHSIISLLKSGMVLADLADEVAGTKAKIGHVWESAKAGWGLAKAGTAAASMADDGKNATSTLDAVAAVGKQTSELSKAEESAHFASALNDLDAWFQAGKDFYSALTLEGLGIDGINQEDLNISDNQRPMLSALLARLRASANEIMAHELEADALASGHGAAMEPESSSRGLIEKLEKSPTLERGLSLQRVRKRRVEVESPSVWRESSVAGSRLRLSRRLLRRVRRFGPRAFLFPLNRGKRCSCPK